MLQHRMTKYEVSRLLGVRANQLAMGASVLIDDVPAHKQSDTMYIAAREIAERRIDGCIRRVYPRDTYVDVKLSDMELPDDLFVLIQTLDQLAY